MCEWSDSCERASLDNQYLSTHPNAEQIKLDGEAYSTSRKYNCHGYAFVKSAGGPRVWIGNGRNNDEYEYNKYLTDGSYIEVTQPCYPGIISWGILHSAVATGQSGIIIEKAGDGPLLKHSLSNSVYGTQGLRYYIKSNANSSNYVFSLTASSPVVCPGSTVTYTLNPVPAGTVQITWENSSHLTLVSSSNGSATFTANSVGDGWVKVKAAINSSLYGNSITLQQETVQVKVVSITGPSLLCNGSSGTFTVSNAPSGYTWTCSSGLTAGSSSGNSKTFTGNNTGNGFLGWVAVNLGSTELARKEVWIGKPYGSPSEVAVGISYGVPQTNTPPLDGSRQKMGITGFNWIWHRNTGNAALTDNGLSATVTVYTSGSHTLYAYGVNSCGGNSTGSPMFAYRISVGNTTYSMSAYPNPVSGTLNVQIEEPETESAALSTSGSSVSGSGGVGRVTPVYTIRLYNASGMPALQTTASDPGTVQLDVGSLPDGIYTLHVSDGSQDPPLTQHIVISH
jgi:hypothetical protein